MSEYRAFAVAVAVASVLIAISIKNGELFLVGAMAAVALGCCS